MSKSRYLYVYLEFLPLAFFIIWIQLFSMEQRQDWLLPYGVSTLVALCTTGVFLYLGRVINRLILAINLYFLTGAIALLVSFSTLNDLYTSLEEIAMLAWMVAVGMYCLIAGISFIGFSQEGDTRAEIKQLSQKYSLLLLLELIIVSVTAYYLKQLGYYSDVLPFLCVFLLHAHFVCRLDCSSAASPKKPE